MTTCEELARFAASLSRAALPGSVLARAELQRRSVVAAARAGERDAAPFAAAAAPGPGGDVYRSAAASIAHDWDDYLYMGHTGHSAVPAARAFEADEERALVAQVAANEVAGRLGAALLIGPHNGQFWSAIHCASASVAAGLALGLDAGALAHALAISLYQPPFGLWPGFMGPPTKLLTAAEPAAQGVRAALLAADGVAGPLDVIEHPRGLLRHFADVPRPRMLGALGSVWLTDTLAFKRRPGCAYLQAAVDAALRLHVDVADVAAIDVEAGLMTVAMDALSAPAPLTPVGVNFSTPLSVAVALTAGTLTHRELRPDWLDRNAAAVRALAARVRVRHDWELTLCTAGGLARGGASLRDVPPRALPALLRRSRELRVGTTAETLRDLAQLARPAARRRIRRLAHDLRRGAPPGIGALDPARLRMTFPCRVRVRLRSGRVVEREGFDAGACGRPLAEQEEVVSEKEQAVAAVPVAPGL